MDELHPWHMFTAVLIPTAMTMFAMWRWKQQDKANIVEEAKRQERVDNDIKNNTAYIKRVEAEYKAQDKKFEEKFDTFSSKVFSKLDELSDKINKVASDLRAHRQHCEKKES